MNCLNAQIYDVYSAKCAGRCTAHFFAAVYKSGLDGVHESERLVAR